MRKGLRLLASLFFLGLLIIPTIVFAQASTTDTFGVSQVNNSIGLVSTDIRVIVGRIIQIILSLLGVIAVGLIIYAGFTIMTAGGSEDKVGEGKKILVNAIVGLVVILSAVAIVQFVLNALSNATGSGGNNGDVTSDISQATKQTFTGSASLGKMVKDHYPMRDQKDVPRTTKIAITFNEPVDPSSIMENTNKTCWGQDGKPTAACPEGSVPYYGDCLEKQVGFSWEKDCDQLKTTNVKIYRKADPNKALVSAAAMAGYDGQKKMTTFVFRPLQLLGSDKEPTGYVVDFTGQVMKDNADKTANGKSTSVFENELSGHYAWEFETNLIADFLPPVVQNIYPGKASVVDRNTIVQIQFSEAIDPVLFSEPVGPATKMFAAIFSNKNIEGTWSLSNGYKTLEFISNQSCGENSCGELMYCIPVPSCVADGKADCKEAYSILLRTGELMSVNPAAPSFEGKPMSGIMDMSGNVLDGNTNVNPEGRPAFAAAQDVKVISADDKKAIYDNYWWNFEIKNSIDLSVPYIHKINPGLDAEGINGSEPITISFSKLMMNDSMYGGGVVVEESPVAKNPDKTGKISDQSTAADWWINPSMNMKEGKSTVTINHRQFGPNGQDLYYFTSVSSSVKSVNQNCLYPGFGPYSDKKGDTPTCTIAANGTTTSCVPVQKNDSAKDTGCSVTDNVLVTYSDIVSCVNHLKSLIIK